MTEMTLHELGEVLEVVAAATRRTFGAADLAIWHPIIKDVPVQFAKECVIAHFRDYPGVWLEPGHIFQRWRTHRLDQVARETRQQREARQEALSAKAAEDIEALAERKGIVPDVPVKFSRRGGNPALAVVCPWCMAGAHRPCHIPGDPEDLTAQPHPSRVERAESRK